MDRARYLQPVHGLRQGMVYSNANYAIITYVVEILTGKTYYQVLNECIFKLLDMDSSSNYTELKSSGAKISQGWLRQDVNSTQCALDTTESASSNDTDTETDPLLALLPPPSCLGVPEGIEFWTGGAGQEWGGGGNVLATCNDLVSFGLTLH